MEDNAEIVKDLLEIKKKIENMTISIRPTIIPDTLKEYAEKIGLIHGKDFVTNNEFYYKKYK